MSPAVRGFVDYFADLGPRWGLPADVCRVHAYLYVTARTISEDEIGAALSLDKTHLRDALTFLADYHVISGDGATQWRTSDDPWDLLIRGLEERSRRELPSALAALGECHKTALSDPDAGSASADRIARMLALVEDLAAIEGQAHRLSPQVLRGLAGMSGRAARFFDRMFPAKGGKP
jgi:DNA-binding transcriptional regulator GbsR (MarR family)